MNPVAVITAGGMLLCAGAVLTALTAHPPAPRLSAAMAQLAASPTDPARGASLPGATHGWARLLPPAATRLARAHVGVAEEDLQITDSSRERLAVRKLLRAAAGLAAPTLLITLLALSGRRPPVLLPAAATLILTAALWVGPSRDVRRDAQAARAQFRAALRAFLTLVAQERAARGSPAEALEEASRGWAGWPYRLLHAEVLRAELAGAPPWQALAQLGDRIGVAELITLADIVAVAADGAAVFDTLLAEARSLHHAELTAQRTAANIASERLIQPVGLLAFGFVVLILIPPTLRLFTT